MNHEDRIDQRGNDMNINQDENLKVNPRDVAGEVRCIEVIGQNIVKIQEALRTGGKRVDCLQYLGKIELNVYLWADYFQTVMNHYLENNDFSDFTSSQYDETIHQYIVENVLHRIWNDVHDDKGMVANYDPEQPFLNYFRSKYAWIKRDVLNRLIRERPLVQSLDELNHETLRVRSVSPMGAEQKTGRLDIGECRELIPEIISVIEQGKHLYTIQQMKKGSEEKLAYIRMHVLNLIVTLIKEICGNDVEYWSLFFHGKEREIFELLHQELLDYVMSTPCEKMRDISDTTLKYYREVDVSKEEDQRIRFYKKGIKYLNEIWCSYQLRTKGQEITEEMRKKELARLKMAKSRYLRPFLAALELKELNPDVLRGYFSERG